MRTNGAMLSGMGGTWKDIHRETWKRAIKAAGLETRDKAIMTVVVQGVIAVSIFFVTHGLDWPARLLAAALPFLLVPLWYVIKLREVPEALSKTSAENQSTLLQAITRERDQVADDLRAARAEIAELRKPPTPPQREIMAIYQMGVKVGTVEGTVQSQLSASRIAFQRVTFGDQFNMDAPFEYGEFTLKLINSQITFGGVRTGGSVSMPMTAEVIGRRQL